MEEKIQNICEATEAAALYTVIRDGADLAGDGTPGVFKAFLPVKITKEEVLEQLHKHVGKKLLCPASFKNGIAEALRLTYVPCWVFNGKMVVKYDAVFGIDRAEKDRYGKSKIATDWYPVGGTYVKELDEFSWDSDIASDKDLAGLEPFTSADFIAYDGTLPGEAEKAAGIRGMNEAWKDVSAKRKEELPQELRERILDDKHCHRIKELKQNIAWTGVGYTHALVPVWIYRREFRGKTYAVMANGETGSLSGVTPMSPGKLAAAAAAVLAVLAGIAFAVKFILSLFA